MTHEPSSIAIRTRILLSLQRALLGRVSPALRGVCVAWDDRVIHLRCCFDGPVSGGDRESMEDMHTEMLADFSEEYQVRLEVVHGPSCQEAPADGVWAYRRRE